jgi:hypothetical protein
VRPRGAEFQGVTAFEGAALVQFPVDEVFIANRDALGIAIAHVEHLQHVVKERYEEPDGTVDLVNVWQATLPIPKLIEAIVKPHMMVWEDRALWRRDDHSCRWTLEAPFFRDAMNCSGVTLFQEASRGRATRVQLRGEIIVDPRGVADAPMIVQRATARAIEEFVAGLFPMTFRHVMDAVSTHLLSTSVRPPPPSIGED